MADKSIVPLTPIILTLNEESNIRATLASLDWAERVVILDSGSTDRTEEFARSFANVEWFVRTFDDHCSQWRYAIQETSVTTEYVLALDADMRPGTGFLDEVRNCLPNCIFTGAWVSFEFRILGNTLAGSIYPSQIRIFRPKCVQVSQVGHTQLFEVSGPLYRFRSKLIHEDRKPMERWLGNQIKYASLEAARIRASHVPSFKDRLRVAGLSPAIWSAYAYLKAGGPWTTPGSRAYAYERLIFEALLARLLCQ